MSYDSLLTAEENELLGNVQEPVETQPSAEPVAAEVTLPATEGQQADPTEQAEAPTEDRIAPVFAPTLTAETVDTNQVADLRKQQHELRKRYANGEIDDEAYEAQSEALQAKRDELLEASLTAKITSSISQQTNVQAFNFQRDFFLKTVDRVDGVPYTSNPLARQAFDQALSAAGQAAVKDNPNITAEELFAQADKAVRDQFAALGVQFGKTKAAQSAPAKRDVPITLAHMPAAAMAPVGDAAAAVLQSIAGLEGDDLEIAVMKMSPDDRRKALAAS